MDNTKIDWADMSWNPVTGCRHDCEYCYARRMARRFCTNEHGHGILAPCDGNCQTCSEMDGLEFAGDKLRIARQGEGPYPYGFMPTLHRYRLDELARKKRPRNIFVGSMADLFGEWVPATWIRDVLDACAAAPQHNYMFLTKNPGRYVELDRMALLPREGNFWYGTTTVTQGEPAFRAPGCKTFMSIEPMLGPFPDLHALDFIADWIIIGAMTGPGSDKHQPERAWVEDIVEQCRARSIPVFMKGSLTTIWGELLLREYPPELGKE